MKTSGMVCLTGLLASTNAWKVQFHTRSNIGWNVHGTRGVQCNTINWPSAKKQEDVQYIK